MANKVGFSSPPIIIPYNFSNYKHVWLIYLRSDFLDDIVGVINIIPNFDDVLLGYQGCEFLRLLKKLLFGEVGYGIDP